MFNQTIHVMKPLNLKVRIHRVAKAEMVVVSDLDGFTMIFEDPATLNDFVQAMYGLAHSIKEEDPPTGG